MSDGATFDRKVLGDDHEAAAIYTCCTPYEAISSECFLLARVIAAGERAILIEAGIIANAYDALSYSESTFFMLFFDFVGSAHRFG